MLTITQAAERLAMHPRTLRRLCRELNLGVQVNPRLWLVAEKDMPKLGKKRRSVGNPTFGKKPKKITT